MAKGSDTGFKVLLGVLVLLVLVGTQSEQDAPPPASGPSPLAARVTPPAPQPSASRTTNIPGGTLVACTGTLLSTETVDVGDRGGLLLQVFYSASDGGRNCAMVSKTGTAAGQRGELTVTLQFHNYDGRRWPRYAEQTSRGGDRSDGIYLDQTDGRCVRASARFDPSRGRAVTVRSGKVGCS